jgi:hypothetical protein
MNCLRDLPKRRGQIGVKSGANRGLKPTLTLIRKNRLGNFSPYRSQIRWQQQFESRRLQKTASNLDKTAGRGRVAKLKSLHSPEKQTWKFFTTPIPTRVATSRQVSSSPKNRIKFEQDCGQRARCQVEKFALTGKTDLEIFHHTDPNSGGNNSSSLVVSKKPHQIWTSLRAEGRVAKFLCRLYIFGKKMSPNTKSTKGRIRNNFLSRNWLVRKFPFFLYSTPLDVSQKLAGSLFQVSKAEVSSNPNPNNLAFTEAV